MKLWEVEVEAEVEEEEDEEEELGFFGVVGLRTD